MATPYRAKSQVIETETTSIDPTRAAAGVARWRRTLGECLGEDPGARLDEPRRHLTLLKIFGSTRRLADLTMKFPTVAAAALLEGSSRVLAEAARDLTALNGGIGGAEALHSAIAPIKARADIAIGLAEISGEWTTAEANAARSDLAERLVETALDWLIRAGIARGELSIDLEDGVAAGVFALAGGDFAHEDLAPSGPIELLIVYDDARFEGPSARMAERAFVRIGAEFREAFEGKTGDHSVFHLNTPMGIGVNGAGVVESISRMKATFEDAQATQVKRWAATARVVAGDRTFGGAFLESNESALWSDEPILTELTKERMFASSDDPRDNFRSIANILRWSLGRNRPVFRTACAQEVFATAASSGILGRGAADRLCAGNDLAQTIVSRAQLMSGAAKFGASGEQEEIALAALCDFDDYAHLSCARDGALADARNGLSRLLDGARSDFARYAPLERVTDDVDKLEDLGFRDGARLAELIDGWASLCRQGGEQRFASIAPGLLTAFGETQKPEMAVRLFDRILSNLKEAGVAFAPEKANDGFVDAIGCFGEAVAPLSTDPSTVTAFFETRGAETPQDAKEWISRFPPPRLSDGVDALTAWRRDGIARCALYAAAGDIDFAVAAAVLAKIHSTTLALVFDALCNDKEQEISLHIYQSEGFGLPGKPTTLGFTAAKAGDEAEALVREFLAMLMDMGEGIFSIAPDVSRRPGGAAGALAPEIQQYREYIQSEAVASDQLLFGRGDVIAGPQSLRDEVTKTLRSAVSNPKRADILFRDLDRARAQRLRRDKAGSEWDLDALEGGPRDVDLIVSTLIYRHAAAQPAIQGVAPDEALGVLVRAGLIEQPVAHTLTEAGAFWNRLSIVRALSQWSDPHTAPVRKRLGKMIARAAEVENFSQVRPIKRGYADEVTRLYAQLVLGRQSLSMASNG